MDFFLMDRWPLKLEFESGLKNFSYGSYCLISRLNHLDTTHLEQE